MISTPSRSPTFRARVTTAEARLTSKEKILRVLLFFVLFATFVV